MARGDGKLSHDLLPGEKGPQDACGVFGVWAPGEEVAKLTYYGLYALQHRGQESAGIATSDGKRINVYKDMGLVSQVFDETTLNTLTGHLAVGHCRYSTTGASHWANAQPTLGATATGTVALAHNGNLTNTAELKAMIVDRNGGQLSGEMKQGNTSDTALVTALLEGEEGKSLEETAMELLPKIKGGFCFVFMDEGTLYAARDTYGIRPLCLGRLERGWVVASEQSALATVGASFIREIEPGEFIAIDEDGVRSQRFAEATPAGCVFEYVYLARPDASIAGRSVYESRVEMGRQLARENTQEADIVIPVPESGTPAAVGYAEESGIPFAHGFVKNAYVGRTFIQPSQTLRQLGIRLKLNALESVIRGKRVVVVDDSIVRGNTQRAIVRMLREAGAAERPRQDLLPAGQVAVLLRHRLRLPCGTDRQRRHHRGNPQAIGADSLAYISEDGMIDATRQPRERLCTACFTGKYPIELPGADKLGKNLLERTDLGGLPAAGTASGGCLTVRLPTSPPASTDEDPAEKAGATGCDPGPDAEFEELLTDADRRHPCCRQERARMTSASPAADMNAAQNAVGITYASAGVDVEAGDRAVELMKGAIKATHNSSVIGGVGGFAGLYDVSKLLTYKRPLLATSTDGVGTKVAIAQAMDIHDTIGFDLVGMVVDDIVVVGAEPLYMTDYIACGKVVPERIADIVRGIAAACSVAGTALVGGETAEHPGLLGEHEYDVAGAATGVVEAADLLGPDRVRAGDVVIGMASSGLHSNGYSLVRRVINHAGWALDRHVSEFSRTLGEELLEPTRVYAADCLDLARTFPVNGSAAGQAVHGFSHVTGGGLAANLARVLPQGLLATVDRATWQLPAIFRLVAELGNVPLADLERTLNLGVGMVAIVSPEAADAAVNRLNERGLPAWVMGTVEENSDSIVKTGPDYVQGAKGVDGGAVRLVNAYA